MNAVDGEIQSRGRHGFQFLSPIYTYIWETLTRPPPKTSSNINKNKKNSPQHHLLKVNQKMFCCWHDGLRNEVWSVWLMFGTTFVRYTPARINGWNLQKSVFQVRNLLYPEGSPHFFKWTMWVLSGVYDEGTSCKGIHHKFTTNRTCLVGGFNPF